MESGLEELIAKDAIREAVITFSMGMDLLDLAMFRSAFAPQVELDIPPRAGDVITLSGPVDADTYARQVIRLLSGWDATQHVSSNHLVEVSGDSALCRCYTHATHLLRDDDGEHWLVAASLYRLTAARQADRSWRFTRFESSRLWTSGDLALWDRVGQNPGRR